MTGPLAGIRVLDLTSVVAGPLATQTLGDMGADVVKIESPDGDTTRYTGPARSPDMAALFMGLNRGKRSLVLDLKEPGGRVALWRLIERADVLVHSMRPQKMEKHGFGSEAVCARNPRIVYAAIHGYRDGGPYSRQPAYDDVIQGQSGFASLMSEIAGEPRYAPTIIADKTTALSLVGAISAALYSPAKKPAAASSSKCRCSNPWCRLFSPSICSAIASRRRSASSAIPAYSARGGGRTGPRTAISA